MQELQFNNLMELYIRLKPALSSKVMELQRNNIKYIKEEDIWNYLRNNKWLNALNLSLESMVDDILHTNNEEIELYILENHNKIMKENSNEQ